MKAYLLILIRISVINFICILLAVVYFSNKSAIARTVSKPARTAVASATITAFASPTLLEVTESPSATPSETESPIPSPTVKAPSKATSQPGTTSNPTSQPTAVPTQQPTPQPTVQATSTPAPTAPPNPLLVKVAPHNTPADCWMVIDAHIYNVTDYLRLHPGGKEPLIPYCGNDGTAGYHSKDMTPPVDHTATSNAMLDLFLVE